MSSECAYLQGSVRMQGARDPIPYPAAGALRAEDVLASVEGGLDDEGSEEEAAENVALAERHSELLAAHGYRMVSLLCYL